VSTAQVAPLLALRWQMVRSRRSRWGFALLASAVPVLCVAAVAAGLLAPRDRSLDIVLLAPTAYLSVALLALLAPLASGGGNDLFPAEQLTAYPITSRTVYRASLALTPLNLAWTVQLIALLGLTAYVSGRTPLMPLALVTCLAFLAFVTVAGQALAWAVIGFRQRPDRRAVTWLVAGVLAGAVLLLAATRDLTTLLDRSPTTAVVTGALAGANQVLDRWALTTGALVLAGVVTDQLGRRLCGWAQRQPGAGSRTGSRPVRRRAVTGSRRREVLAIDRASVWRSPALRRGLLVLGILPGAVAAVARLDWPALVLLPGLVAAGAGLLFGVNAFCLDGSGAVWLASLPVRPGTLFWSKARVVAETCAVAVVITVAAGSLRAQGAPSAGEAAALAACALVVVLRVMATCMELSVTRPFRADLLGPRDTPAPPGVMAAYSARLAVSTTLVAVLFSTLAEVAAWPWPVVVAVPFCLMSSRRLVRASRGWEDAGTRARVVGTVASG
jgi:hypothetical protein